MKDIKELINEAAGNSIPWSDTAAIIYTMWLIATDGDLDRLSKHKHITTLLDILPKETINRVWSLITKKMYQGNERVYRDNIVDVLGDMQLIAQTKGIKYN